MHFKGLELETLEFETLEFETLEFEKQWNSIFLNLKLIQIEFSKSTFFLGGR